MDEQKKISLPETLILTMYIGFTDLIGIVLVFAGLDDFGILDAITFPVTQFYFRIKGVKATADLIGNLIELIPYVGALPIRTITLLITIYAANHPEKIGAMGSLMSAAKTK
ncbi:MAG: hypothetical protein UU85_C0004G0107 [Candidatus Wolfebacteria bacterium GW2011_GWA2_42_10]|uniref:Uncharacterized protein n=2 Tax=Candidatus Wolfeibacteriota TaxID=1752735 RepID=A0A0G1AJ77_9BACT|nr:MAG: hypothetical protein UU38_C0001G0168 [Candidatus Wolfebacteria bacterium GW2011_GWB1_41_12]KKS25348.1 MAG: hypothetical protein UU85_C0004G0107 [Candidatus Wolfebacteria bacterium GW2011_GWA2_42_10]KKT56787.1 MAG: hypothetical protein UW50_C0001G0356 [Candidatus Wolfebacteria bacterium GW2011_GWA1_44_24]